MLSQLLEKYCTNNNLYFFHLVPKNSDMSKGLTSLDYQYTYNITKFHNNSYKYRYRLCNEWQIYPGRNPDELSDDEVYIGINKFRGTLDGNNQIYFFRFPPYKNLGYKMKEILQAKDIYRINIDDITTRKFIKTIDWGYDGSFTGNTKLDRTYYENISIDSYYEKYNETNTSAPLFAPLNHISICPKYGYIPYNCLTKVPVPVSINDVYDIVNA